MPYPLETFNDGSVADRNFQNLAKDMNPPVPQARVYNSVDITLTTATIATLTFDSERYDSGGLHSTAANTSRLTAPISGLYEIGANVQFAGSAAGYRQIWLVTNGATVIGLNLAQPEGVAAIPTVMTITVQTRLAATDYVECLAYQTSGGNLNVTAAGAYSPDFWMCRLGGYVNQGV